MSNISKHDLHLMIFSSNWAFEDVTTNNLRA